MVALSYLSERLGLPPSHFLDEQTPAWTRLEVDMRLAAGEWQAADGYQALLNDSVDDQVRAEVLRGQAEALVRLDRGREAVAAAAEAARLFSTLGRTSEERSAATGWPTACTCPMPRPMRAACCSRSWSACAAA